MSKRQSSMMQFMSKRHKGIDDDDTVINTSKLIIIYYNNDYHD